MTILALDLGTTTGWACGASLTQCRSGSTNFAAGRFQGGGMRFLKFERWLDEFTGITEVVFEEVRRHMGVDAAHAYGGFLATLTKWCEARHIPYEGVPVGTIKKHATGKGNAKKPDMIAAAVSNGFKPKDDNEADAIALFRYRLSKIKGPDVLS